jgi:hypothetical protein
MKLARAHSPLPPKVSYYLRHLLAGHFALAPASTLPPGPPDRRLTLSKGLLLRAPESPELRAALIASAAPGVHAWLVSAGTQVHLVLKDHGTWRVRLPRHGRSFDRLRELTRPDHLLPQRFTQLAGKDGGTRHLHTIPLRWHQHGHLSLEVRRAPGGNVGYDAWVWIPGRRRVVPLFWDERERVIALFKDLTASYFRCEPPPPSAAAMEDSVVALLDEALLEGEAVGVTS